MIYLKRKCPICEHRTGTSMHKQAFKLLASALLPEKQEIVHCCQCGFVFVNSSIKKEYYEKYILLNKMHENPEKAVSLKEYNELLDLVNILADYIPSLDSRILHINSGNGQLLKHLKICGYKDLTGMDISEVNLQHLKTYGIKGIHSDVMLSIPITSRYLKYFDFVICSDVLNKIYDVKTAAHNLVYLTKFRGRLFIENVDSSCYYENNFHPFYQFKADVLNHFDSSSIINLVRQEIRASILCSSRRLKVIEGNKKEVSNYLVLQFLKQRDSTQKIKLRFATDTVKNVSKYIEASKNIIKQSSKTPGFQRLSGLVEMNKPVIVWGAGNTTYRLLESTVLEKCNIEAFIDSDVTKQGSFLLGKRVLAPDYLYKSECKHIVVCSVDASEEIMQQLNEMKIDREITVIVFK